MTMTTPDGAQRGSPLAKHSPAANVVESATTQDVWLELFATVSALSETVDTASQAFGSDGDKVVSATTKKRLLIKALQGLKQSKDGIQLLTEHIKALQFASQQWQRTMLFASKSHEGMLEQLESTHRELHATGEKLRSTEAQRLVSARTAETLRLQLTEVSTENAALKAALKQREDDLETAQFASAEAQAEMSHMSEATASLHAAKALAEQKAERAVAALDGVQAEAAKAHASAERHRQVVAKLTADNLMFVMTNKKLEADLAAANQDKAALRLAAEKQRGPWFDEVRAGVEERVKGAMARAEALETELEMMRSQHADAIQVLRSQQADLEEYLGQVRASEASLEAKLRTAVADADAATASSSAATSAADTLRARVQALEAEKRVLNDSIRQMRQECTERWVSEQAALGKVSGLEAQASELSGRLDEALSGSSGLRVQLDIQAGLNRQLMQRKEEVEWQLMAAMAKLDEGGGHAPVPLNLLVSGMLQVDRSQQHQQPTEEHLEKSRPGVPPRELREPSAPPLMRVAAPPPQMDAPTPPHAAFRPASETLPPIAGSPAKAPTPGSPARGVALLASAATATAVDVGLSPRRTAAEAMPGVPVSASAPHSPHATAASTPPLPQPSPPPSIAASAAAYAVSTAASVERTPHSLSKAALAAPPAAEAAGSEPGAGAVTPLPQVRALTPRSERSPRIAVPPEAVASTHAPAAPVAQHPILASSPIASTTHPMLATSPKAQSAAAVVPAGPGPPGSAHIADEDARLGLCSAAPQPSPAKPLMSRASSSTAANVAEGAQPASFPGTLATAAVHPAFAAAPSMDAAPAWGGAEGVPAPQLAASPAATQPVLQKPAVKPAMVHPFMVKLPQGTGAATPTGQPPLSTATPATALSLPTQQQERPAPADFDFGVRRTGKGAGSSNRQPSAAREVPQHPLFVPAPAAPAGREWTQEEISLMTPSKRIGAAGIVRTPAPKDGTPR